MTTKLIYENGTLPTGKCLTTNLIIHLKKKVPIDLYRLEI